MNMTTRQEPRPTEPAGVGQAAPGDATRSTPSGNAPQLRHTRPSGRLERLGLAWTHHARTQAKRRSISARHIEWALDCGALYFAGSGAIGYFYGRRASRGECCPDSAVGVAVIVAGDQAIITVMHAPRPPQHWRRAR